MNPKNIAILINNSARLYKDSKYLISMAVCGLAVDSALDSLSGIQEIPPEGAYLVSSYAV